ncbi:Rtf2 RING-finger-domain-containing protein [Daedaleopsis nitida]|nr:Rtf2 RING-finger-domain-containing protein [Daedaleopsis nitida]
MGNDGGSIPDRRDLVKSKPKAEQADRANQIRAMWFFCALSKRPLQEPVVSCPLGKLYNKDALLEFLLDRSSFGGEGEIVCGHIRSLKDVKTLKLTPNASKSSSPAFSESAPERASFVCPLNFKEMNGSQPFVYIHSCGCVFSQAGLKAVSSTPPSKSPGADADAGGSNKSLDLCPQCGAKYDRTSDILTLNPSPELEEEMRASMEVKRLLEPAKTKGGKGKKRKAPVGESGAAEPPTKKLSVASASTNPSIAAASRAVTQELAKEEAKRKAGMSDAVKSLYASKDGSKKKETFMTMGTFTRYA